ncbi:MAG: dTDP-4-dehydrorhamnose reductase [Desulfuromonadaceae bacterium]|nr:dTDP-4-dehydrorhamnose reductase [Desulfuromonadaceae bacterium]
MVKRKIALIGANGMLASMFQHCLPHGTDLHRFDLPDFDVTDGERVRQVLLPLQPDIILNCSAFTRVDECETQQQAAFAVNGEGPKNLAVAAQEVGATLVHISTDFVFSGAKQTPYTELDAPAPLSVYGQSKWKGEQAILESGLKDYYIVRTSWLYGPCGGNFVETMRRLACERETIGVVADQLGTPTYTGDLVEAVWALLGLIPGSSVPPAPAGIYHFSNEGQCSWYEFACEIMACLKRRGGTVKVREVRPLRTEEYPVAANRPAYSVLSKEKYRRVTGRCIPSWLQSLERYLLG